ncbi:hypothetical protein [uncultured Sphingomonas sp.]|uniref:hypothetical protein n=1 Tax=uncultured Sphingomonas sp. TaxID=158754 RepID=UPI0025DA10F7|nr:hypothetical protein [uncultured Sphingomonas sp.]
MPDNVSSAPHSASSEAGTQKKPAKKTASPKTRPVEKVAKPRGKAGSRPFPHLTFEEAFQLAEAIQAFAGSNAVRRLTLFDHLKRAPESGPTRQWVTTAARYGLIKGNAASEMLELTPDGDVATNKDVSQREQTRARIKLAIDSIELFKNLYSKFSGQKLPSPALMEDATGDLGIDQRLRKEAVEMFIVNLRFVGLLQTLSGAERILTTDHALDQLPASRLGEGQPTGRSVSADAPMIVHSDAHFDRVCFFIGPIGEDGSDHRKHSDLMLESLIRPTIESLGLEVKRADEILNPGLINKQIFEFLLKSRLAIADLSFHNPNVFYELAIRHARNLPVVQMIRKADRIPFDINQSRTIIVDTTDLYSFVPKIDTYRAEISSHIRRALDDPASAENPFAAFFPE